jgi:acyl-CoA oxidase
VPLVATQGSAEQKTLLSKMGTHEYIGCWALTEPSNGSDAAALTTSARRVPGGYVLNGQKRWIGNGTFAEVTVVWARNTETEQVCGVRACFLLSACLVVGDSAFQKGIAG